MDIVMRSNSPQLPAQQPADGHRMVAYGDDGMDPGACYRTSVKISANTTGSMVWVTPNPEGMGAPWSRTTWDFVRSSDLRGTAEARDPSHPYFLLWYCSIMV